MYISNIQTGLYQSLSSVYFVGNLVIHLIPSVRHHPSDDRCIRVLH